jgi:hypothetical protein
MTHDPVDRLFEDLETALSVQPSPALAAQVRRRIETQQQSVRPPFRLWAGAVVAVAAILVTGYATWHSPQVDAPRTERPEVLAALATSSPDAAASPTPAVTEEPRVPVPAPQPRTSVSASRRADPRTDEPLVIVSAADRLGFEQLRAAVASGRITADTLVSSAVIIEPTIVIPTMVQIGQPDAATGGPGSSTGDRGGDGLNVAQPDGLRFVPETVPPTYTRSNS